MEVKKVEVFSESKVGAVVRMPDRENMGSVMPIDSLFLLHGQAMDVLEELKHNPGSDVFYAAYNLAAELEERLEQYISVCRAGNIRVGFRIELSVQDYSDLLI